MNIKILEFSKTVLVCFLPMYNIEKTQKKSGDAIFGQF